MIFVTLKTVFKYLKNQKKTFSQAQFLAIIEKYLWLKKNNLTNHNNKSLLVLTFFYSSSRLLNFLLFLVHITHSLIKIKSFHVPFN